MIDPSNIRRASRARGFLRFWAQILIQSAICLAVVLLAAWFFLTVDAAFHPATLQLPTR